jgi:Holliday junction resolvasome RuvABC endonuclease subunit
VYNKILALDQASEKSGYSIFDNGELVKYGLLKLSDIKKDKFNEPYDERVTNVKEFLKQMIATYNIDLVISEVIQKQVNIKTYKDLAYLQGVLKNYLYDNYIPYGVVKPTEWRSALKINGGKTRQVKKQNALAYVKYNYGVEVTEDEADSICIGTASIKLLEKNKLELHKDI